MKRSDPILLLAAALFAAAPPSSSVVAQSRPRCSLSVSPPRARPADTVAITYTLSGLPFPVAVGDTRFAEEALGRSLRVRDPDGTLRRLQARPMHLLGIYPVDSVRQGQLRYQVRWPSPMLGLIDTTRWNPGWLSDPIDSAVHFTWPLGAQTLTASLRVRPATPAGMGSAAAVRTPQDSGIVLTCASATLIILAP